MVIKPPSLKSVYWNFVKTRFYLLYILSVEADTIGDSREHIAAGLSVLDSDTYPDGIAGGVDHGLEVKV